MKTKFNLTKSEQRAHSANLERLKSTGLVTGAENPALCESRLIRIVQSGLGVIHAGTGKGIAFAVCVRLTVLQSGIAICDYDFTIPGCESAKIFLAEISERSHSYRPLGWLDLERDVVLNDLILKVIIP